MLLFHTLVCYSFFYWKLCKKKTLNNILDILVLYYYQKSQVKIKHAVFILSVFLNSSCARLNDSRVLFVISLQMKSSENLKLYNWLTIGQGLSNFPQDTAKKILDITVYID